MRRYRCSGCGYVWRQDTTAAAEPRAKLSRRALRWALEGIVCQHLTVARVAEGLAVSWNTANNAVLAEGRRVHAILARQLPPSAAAKLAAELSGAPRKALYGSRGQGEDA